MDITAPTADSSPQPNNTTVIKLRLNGDGFEFLINGQPFPFPIADDEPIETVHNMRGGPPRVRITLLCDSIEVEDQTRPAPELVPVDVPPAVASLVEAIAKTHTAITYHERDRNRLAIEYAAARAGLAVIPSATIQPRTVKGAGAPRG